MMSTLFHSWHCQTILVLILVYSTTLWYFYFYFNKVVLRYPLVSMSSQAKHMLASLACDTSCWLCYWRFVV